MVQLSQQLKKQDIDRIEWMRNLPFLGVYFCCVFVLWTDITWVAFWVGLVALLVRMFGLTAGEGWHNNHHRYTTSE